MAWTIRQNGSSGRDGGMAWARQAVAAAMAAILVPPVSGHARLMPMSSTPCSSTASYVTHFQGTQHRSIYMQLYRQKVKGEESVVVEISLLDLCKK